MPIAINMPQLGESVTEGTIGKWLKQPGEHVEKYEALLEVITDKVDTEVPAPAAGIVREIKVAEGSTVRVGTLLALLDDLDAPQADAVSTVAPPAHVDSAQNTFLSPVVARLVAEHQVDISQVVGTGQSGRVTKQDVLKYVQARDQAASATVTLAQAPTIAPESVAEPARTAPHRVPADAEILPLSPMRRAIAEHMVRSVNTAPHVTTVFEIDAGAIVADRARRLHDFERQAVKLTLTAYFVQAAAAALRAVPVLNSSYVDTGIVLHQRIHIGMAVALEEGLLVPVIRDADEKSLLGLARTINDLSTRARNHHLAPDETQAGTFTITNHGVNSSLFATPIINQPQVAILGIGAIQKRTVVVSQAGVDAIAIRPMCYLSLTFDHRALDGATADRFLIQIKTFIEDYTEQ